MRFDLSKVQIKSTTSSGTEKKRSAGGDRPRSKRTKPFKHLPSTQPPVQIDIKSPVELNELNLNSVKQERAQSEPSSIPFIKTEVPQETQNSPLQSSPLPLSPPLPSPSPPLPSPSISPQHSLSLPSPPPTIPIPDLEEESIATNLNAIKLEPCIPSTMDMIKIEDEIKLESSVKMEPISLTADEIRKAEEGQAAAAMLLEQMSDVEQKYNPPLTPSPPPHENISDSKFSPPDYLIKREFHPEDMLTSTVHSITTE